MGINRKSVSILPIGSTFEQDGSIEWMIGGYTYYDGYPYAVCVNTETGKQSDFAFEEVTDLMGLPNYIEEVPYDD